MCTWRMYSHFHTMACACGWDTMKELKEFRATGMNVLVISLYFLHPTATESTRFSSIVDSPFTKYLKGIFKTDSDGMQDIQKNSWRIKDKTKNNPNYLQTTFLSKFCMSITWELLQTNTHYYSYLEGNKQTRKPVEMHPERTSLNSSQITCTFLREKNKKTPEKQKKKNKTTNKQTPIKKKPQRSCVTYKVLCMDKDSNFPCAFPMGSRSIL